MLTVLEPEDKATKKLGSLILLHPAQTLRANVGRSAEVAGSSGTSK